MNTIGDDESVTIICMFRVSGIFLFQSKKNIKKILIILFFQKHLLFSKARLYEQLEQQVLLVRFPGFFTLIM